VSLWVRGVAFVGRMMSISTHDKILEELRKPAKGDEYKARREEEA